MNVVPSLEFPSSGDEQTPKVRKPYTITKQRERWTEDEHKKFLEALKLYGRAWLRIEEHIGTKTAIQIRSHAQKFFTKVARETSSNGTGSSNGIEIPPPRPKRKPMRPYPRKLANISKKETPVLQQENRSPSIQSPMCSSFLVSSITQQGHSSPSTASCVTGQDLIEPNQMNCEVPDSSVGGASVLVSGQPDPESGVLSASSSSAELNLVGSFVSQDNRFLSPHSRSKRSTSPVRSFSFPNVDSSACNAREGSQSGETNSGSAIKDPSTKVSSTSLKLFGQTVFVTPSSATTPNSGKPSLSTFEKEDPSKNVATIQMEAHFRSHPLKPAERASSHESPKGSLQEGAWSLWPSSVPSLGCCHLLCQQGDSNSDVNAIAPCWVLYGNPPFSFMQHGMENDSSNAQKGGDAAFDLVSDSCYLDDKKAAGSVGSEAASVTDNDVIEKGSCTGEARHEDSERSGLFNRKVFLRSSGNGFVPYRRCAIESNKDNKPQFHGNREEKRIRLCL